MDSARGNSADVRDLEGRQQAAWRMRRRSWGGRGGYPRLRLQRLTRCLLLRAPLRRAGPPAAARLRRPFHTSAPSPAEYRPTAAERRGVWQAGMQAGGLLCAPHPCLCQGVHPRGREEEGDDGGEAHVSCHMQKGHATLQQRGWAWGRQEGGQLSRLCAPLTIFSFASGSTPGVARRSATM